MKITAKLPSQKHFALIEHQSRYQFCWSLIGSDRLRIYSNSIDWSKPQNINVRCSQAKSNKSRFTNRIDFQVSDSPLPGTIEAEIIFEWVKGIPHSNRPTLFFAAIPCKNSQGESMFLLISIKNKGEKDGSDN